MTRIDPPADGYGVVDQLKSAIVDSNGVAKSFVQDRFNTLFRWVKQASTPVQYTPDVDASTTAPDLGSGGNFEQDGSYTLIGRMCFWEARLRFGTSGATAGSGTYFVGLPFVPRDRGRAAVIGSGYVFDNSLSDTYLISALARDNGEAWAQFYWDRQTLTAGNSFAVNDQSPVVFAASDIISAAGMFEIAT